jgi:molecular chaperone HscB
VSHFDIFSLPPSVDVDVPALEKKYRELSLLHHPDRAPANDARARRIALEQTTALNDAFKVLKDPIRRAVYLLKLQGIDLDKEHDGARKTVPMEFLQEILDRREALDALKAKKDVGGAQKMGESMQKELDGALAQAHAALRASPVDTETATEQLVRVRYFQRFLEEVEAIEEASL